MNAPLRALARALLPRPLRRWLTRHQRLRFTGPYPDWAAARAASSGYDAPEILQRIATAAREVAAGRAAYERDTVLFTEPHADPFLLGAIQRVAPSGTTVPLRVLDFGGSLGSTFLQMRPWLAPGRALRWDIVEQPAVAELGRREYQTAELRFHASLDAALDPDPAAPDVVLLSSVLSYVEHPWPILQRLAALPAAAWIVTRTCFSDTPDDRVVVQHVPASIYRASYPAWVFAGEKFRRFWTERDCSLAWHSTVEGGASAGPLHFAFKNVVILPRGAAQETASTASAAL